MWISGSLSTNLKHLGKSFDIFWLVIIVGILIKIFGSDVGIWWKMLLEMVEYPENDEWQRGEGSFASVAVRIGQDAKSNTRSKESFPFTRSLRFS